MTRAVSAIPVLARVTEVLVITDEPSGMRAKLVAIKVNGGHLVPVICGPGWPPG